MTEEAWMKHVDKLYAPSHVILPVGPSSSLGVEEAAIVCSEYMRNYHTVIPLVLRLDYDETLLHRNSTNTFSADTKNTTISSQLRQALYQMQSFGVGKRVISSEQELLGRWMQI